MFEEKADSGSGGGGGSTVDTSYVSYWRGIADEIKNGNEKVITVNAFEKSYSDMPSSVLTALKGTDKTLHLSFINGETVTITGEQLESMTIKRDNYTHKELKELFPTEEPTPSPNPEKPSTDDGFQIEPYMVVAGVVVVVVIIAAVGVAVMRKKRKNK